MKKANILVVEDESVIQQLVSYNLIRAGFSVTCADTGEEALDYVIKEDIDCVLLYLMLPGMSGLEVCTKIQSKFSSKKVKVPIIILSAKGEEGDIVAGLERGADDYITKPFSPKVLIARINAVLRRAIEKSSNEGAAHRGVIIADKLVINKGRHEVRLDGELLQLTMTEFGVLALLAAKPGWVFTRQQIIDSVRGYDFLITPRAIDVQIFGLRKKLGNAEALIETVRGVGYRFKSAEQ